MRGGVAMALDGVDVPADLDTGWFVYGVADADASLPDGLAGVDDEPVRLVAHGRVAVLASRIVLDRPPGRGADLLAYHGVLDAAAAEELTVAPVRFGSVLADEQELVDELLVPGEAHFAALLESLQGRQEFLLQGVYEQELLLGEVIAADPEIAELRSRTRDLPEDVAYSDRVRLGELVARAVEDRQASDAAYVLDAVVPLTDDFVERPVVGLERAFDVALLVHDSHREQLEERLERLAEELHPRLRLQLRGPTAPYDFTGGA